MSITHEAKYKSTSEQMRMRAIPSTSDSPFVNLALWEVFTYLSDSEEKKKGGCPTKKRRLCSHLTMNKENY